MTEENSYIVRGKPNSSLLIMAVFLTLVSLIFIYDLAVADGTYFRGHDLVVRQGVMMTMGAVLALVLGHINYHQVVEHVIVLLYIICFFAMVCKIWPSVGGSFWNDSYIRLGDISFNISDLLQFEACVSFAGVAAIPRQKRGVLRDMSSVLMAAVGAMFISMALAFEEIPGAILILLIALLLCFIRKPTVAGRCAVILTVFLLMTIAFSRYGMSEGIIERISAWRAPFDFRYDIGYETVQSLYASASGGAFGEGIGSMMIPGILPEGTSLFILSGIAREIGIVGAMAVLMLYVLLLCQLYTITCSAADALGFYLGVAITGYFTITFIINIFMTVGLLPVSSIYIPFLAYGGSRHLLNFAMIGIMLNISRYGEVRE